MQKIISLILIYTFFSTFSLAENFSKETQGIPDSGYVLPPQIAPKSASEYFSTNPKLKFLVPVNVWGQVQIPGVYYLPVDTTVAGSIGAAGGPRDSASNSIQLLRDKKKIDLDLYAGANDLKIQKNDIIIMERSLKSDLPLIFSGVSVSLAITTLIVLLTKKK